MAITNSQSKSPTDTSNVAVGRHFNSTEEAPFTVKIGFRPRYVKVINLTDSIQGEWFEGMADDSMHAVSEGALFTSNGITVTEKGFTMGADSLVNGVNMQITWLAIG